MEEGLDGVSPGARGVEGTQVAVAKVELVVERVVDVVLELGGKVSPKKILQPPNDNAHF